MSKKHSSDSSTAKSKVSNKLSGISRSVKKNLCVDNLFPSEIQSGSRGNRFDVETLFANSPLNNEPELRFSSDLLLARINKRRNEKLKCYRQMLNYCHSKIAETDSNNGTDIVVTIVESFPECKEYNTNECLEYISNKLREEDINTFILNDNTIFITWYCLELKKEEMKKKEEEEKKKKEEENKKRIIVSESTKDNAN